MKFEISSWFITFLFTFVKEPTFICFSDTKSEASDSEGITAFSYEGDEADGSTKIKAKSATYDDFTAGLVRTKYSQNQVEAILANRGDGDKSHEAEFDAYQAWRIQAKQIAQEVLAREL